MILRRSNGHAITEADEAALNHHLRQHFTTIRTSARRVIPAVPDVLKWLERKLKRKSGTGSPYVVPAAIRFTTRHQTHAKAAEVIGAHWDSLTKDEREWLARTWPGAFTQTGTLNGIGATSAPALLETDIYESECGPTGAMNGAPEEIWWGEFDSAYAKAVRGASK